MKRLLFLAAVVAVALLLGLPWYIGHQTEARYRTLTADAGEAASLVSFQRGWFRSRAELAITGDTPWLAALTGLLAAEAPAASPLRLTDRIAHGPLPWTAGGDLGWRPALVVVETSDGTGRVLSRYRLALDGGVTGRVGLDRAQARLPGAGDARLAGASARFRAAGDGRKWSVEFRARELVLDGPRGELGASDLEFRLDRRQSPAGLWLGTADGSLGELALEAGASPGFRFGGLSVRSRSSQQGDALSWRLDAEIERAGGPNNDYGPGAARVQLQGLDAASLARLQATALRLAAADTRRLDMALAGALYAELPRLLAHRPRLVLETLTLRTSEGPVTGSGRMALETDEALVLNNPYLLERALRGELSLRAPEGVVERLARLYLTHRAAAPPPEEARQWLSRQIERGTLERDGDSLTLQVRYASGRITLNGRPWPEAEATAP